MEDQLEQVAEHNKNWKEILREFWQGFIPLVEKAEKEASVPKISTLIDCPNCGHKLQKIWSRSKYFYGCSNYPVCEFTAPIEALEFNKEDYDPNFDWDQPCPKCQSPMTLRHGRFGAFLGCSKYPECKGIVNIPKKGEQTFKTEDLPKCPAVGCDGHMTARKSRFGKTFFSCSNYPDCDVIVNDPSELAEKYPDHPKTAYVKKSKFKKGAKEKGGKEKSASAKKKSNFVQSSYKLSTELSQVLGVKEATRPEATKLIWDYIKSNKLQDPANKRLIRPDEKLSKVFGSKEPVDMMKLSGLLSRHFKK